MFVREVSVYLWLVMIVCAPFPLIVIIRTWLRFRNRRREGLCLSCGYDLTGNESGVCPECGTVVGST